MGPRPARHRPQSVRLSSRAERADHRDFRRARPHERRARLFRAAALAPRQSAAPEGVGQGSFGVEFVGYSAERRNDEVMRRIGMTKAGGALMLKLRSVAALLFSFVVFLSCLIAP